MTFYSHFVHMCMSLTRGPLSSPTSSRTWKLRAQSVKRDGYNAALYFWKKHLACRRKLELMSVVIASAEDSIMRNICASTGRRASAGWRASNRAFLSERCFSQIRWERWGKCSVACIVRFLFPHLPPLLLLLFLLRVLFPGDWFKVKVPHHTPT